MNRRSGQYRRVLLVGSEVHSTGLDVTTRGRDVAVIFGDDEAREGSASLKPLREDGPQRRVPLDQLADEIGNFLFGDDKNGDL